MVSRSYLHYRLAIRNVEYCFRNRHKFFSSCIIGNCYCCYFIQYYQWQKTARLKQNYLKKKVRFTTRDNGPLCLIQILLYAG